MGSSGEEIDAGGDRRAPAFRRRGKGTINACINIPLLIYDQWQEDCSISFFDEFRKIFNRRI